MDVNSREKKEIERNQQSANHIIARTRGCYGHLRTPLTLKNKRVIDTNNPAYRSC